MRVHVAHPQTVETDRVAAPGPAVAPATAMPKKPNKKARQFWLRQLHSWHWISAAISLVGMFLFAVTGITLNHAGSISAEPVIETREAVLPPALLQQLETPPADDAPLPGPVAEELRDLVDIKAGGIAAEWSPDEVYVAVPGPGSDAWVSIDLASGAIMAEATDRGWISYFNDLHKGRNTGTAWFWFIDVFSVICIIFTFTGLLLLQLHAKHRPSTWPLVGFGLAVPLAIMLFFLHL
jgi:hypothetical protein